MNTKPYFHVDVFAKRPFTGNSLAVFHHSPEFDASQMLAVTQEMRHFETIFLSDTDQENVIDARVFDLFEELDFAGHPLLGAGAVLHYTKGAQSDVCWTFRLPQKEVTVVSSRKGDGFHCILNQGKPEFLGELNDKQTATVCKALNLDPADLWQGVPLEVVSTGLRYLIVPVDGALEKAKILTYDFDELLRSFGAQFVYVLDVGSVEGRHWNNDGIQEDVATGSAAGTVGAYLAKHGLVPLNAEFVLSQGRYVGRPSEISVKPIGQDGFVESVMVGGDVSLVAECALIGLPGGKV